MPPGVCFRCNQPATRGIYADGTGLPSGYVCLACDRDAMGALVKAALDAIEGAQRQIGTASEKLSPISFGGGAHARLRKLYDRIHAEWYQLRDRRQSQWSCDDNYWAARWKEHQKR